MALSDEQIREISDLVINGYTTVDFFILNSYITLRTLKSFERDEIYLRYKHLSRGYMMFQIVDVLTLAVDRVGGIKLNDSYKINDKLLKTNSKIIFKMYDEFQKLEKKLENFMDMLYEYVKTTESRNSWSIFKNFNKVALEDLKKNQIQNYWVLLNLNDDLLEDEKRQWSRTEYMTNYICAFVDPKQYKRLKNQMSVVSKIGQEETNEEYDGGSFSEPKPKGEYIDGNKEFFDSVKRKKDESKEQWTERVHELMKKQLAGEVVDEHDKIIREYELNMMAKMIQERRGKNLIFNEIKRRNKLQQTENFNEIGDDEKLFELDQSVKDKGFYADGVSYWDIIKEKAFMSIPLREKEKVFEKIINDKFDLEKGVDDYLKNLSKVDKMKPVELVVEPVKKFQEKTPAQKAMMDQMFFN